jgi:hypothetical protein
MLGIAGVGSECMQGTGRELASEAIVLTVVPFLFVTNSRHIARVARGRRRPQRRSSLSASKKESTDQCFSEFEAGGFFTRVARVARVPGDVGWLQVRLPVSTSPV